MKEGGEFYPIKPFASKAAEQVNRIAALFAFSESLEKPIIDIKINLQQIERAIVLVNYYLGEVLRVIGSGIVDPDLYLAELTLDWIKRSRLNQIFPIADIYQRGPAQIRTAEKARKIMNILKGHGYVLEVNNIVIDGNNVRSAWHLESYKDNANQSIC